MVLQDRVNKVEKEMSKLLVESDKKQNKQHICQRLMKKLNLNRSYISQHTDSFYALFNNSWQELLRSVYEIK